MSLFRAKEQFEMAAIDILYELTLYKRCNRYVLVMNDRYTKVVRTVPFKRITSGEIAKEFFNNWVFVYRPPKKLLCYNGKNSCQKLSSIYIAFLG